MFYTHDDAKFTQKIFFASRELLEHVVNLTYCLVLAFEETRLLLLLLSSRARVSTRKRYF